MERWKNGIVEKWNKGISVFVCVIIEFVNKNEQKNKNDV